MKLISTLILASGLGAGLLAAADEADLAGDQVKISVVVAAGGG